ncbi:restriction endonuclease [Microbacterium fluvii]|uniref:Restriction endonuclease n=1 Tax=Microbacterium fluvii TaxID=415215 RepID=A0ABW2HCV3_9MICO|nr:restriction endonuclease [Microbacterium fluvii]MCU4671885.1 restriction endonuclease [Microbacterium fluvii]
MQEPTGGTQQRVGSSLVEPWRRYQHDVADFYLSLGMAAEVDVKGYPGSRATHDIDVLVQTKIGGQTITWIVECKQWARPIPKERVLTLQGVVADVGADRGILLCERGFQAGAYRAAVATNTTLTSLADLRENTQAEREAASLQAITRRAAQTAQRVSQLWPWATPLVPRGAFTVEEMLEVATPSLELTHYIVPRLHIGESVQMIGELADHRAAGGALDATASLLTEVEARLTNLEQRRERNAASAGQHFAQIETNASTFIDLVATPDLDSVATPAVQAMRNISDAADQILATTPSEIGNALRRVMVYMLDSVYLLPAHGADDQEREQAKETAKALVARAQTMLAEIIASRQQARTPSDPAETAG